MRVSLKTKRMGEINMATSADKPGVGKLKKQSTRVDLTPMVDLGFLLITFFVFTTSMGEPRSMNLAMPAHGDPSKIGTDVVMTVIPLDQNKILYYHGELKTALQQNLLGVANYSQSGGISSIIRQKQDALDKSGKGRKEMMLLIAPSDRSSFGNLVDLLDEVLINEVPRYAVIDLGKEEKLLLAEQNIHL